MSEAERGDRTVPWERAEEDAAASEAAAIGGMATDEDLDPAERPLVEAGEGVAEGFEVSEEELIGRASHRDDGGNPLEHAFPPEAQEAPDGDVYGEADHERSSESA